MLREVAPTGSSADLAKNVNVMINGGKFTTINTEDENDKDRQ